MIVKTLAILTWCSALIALIAGAELIILSTPAKYNIAFGGLGTAMRGIGESNPAAGMILAIIGLFYLAIGTGLWTNRGWARAQLAIMALASGIISVASTIFGIAYHGQVIAPVISLIIAGLEVWLLEYQQDIRKLFAQTAEEAAQVKVAQGIVHETKHHRARGAKREKSASRQRRGFLNHDF
jgi:hypothetical protein